MANLKPRNLQNIRSKDEQLGDCLKDITDSINYHAQQTNASPTGSPIPAPTQHAALNVSGGAGYFSAQIVDNSPSFRGKENFIAVSSTKDFSNAHKIHLGASKTWYGYLGTKTLHFASYSAYPTSGPGAAVYALGVDGTASAAPDVPGDSEALHGFGLQPFTTPTVPKR